MSIIEQVLGKLRRLVQGPCSQVHRLLFDYAQGNLDADTARKLEKHIGDCPPCLKYVESYRKTIGACRKHCAPCDEMPAELKQKLQEFIQREL